MSKFPVARGFIPVRLRSSRNPTNAVCLSKRVSRFWGRFATQRGQVPSPQAFGSTSLTRTLKPTSFPYSSTARSGRRFALCLPLETL
ncbi:hypothetical protein PS662_02623 [Pseudomonas fluorescens]|uniref:Uncharacterized protein n=1 Tax=Pseudomonas fluorescens TaxID=294 RepID=A0A5E6T830_PSEFL|nr:hypothetical protein PS662_02623 [Pseudomonas fluorescens]